MPNKDLVTQIDEMTKVIELKLKGENPTAISRQLGLTRVKVLEYIDSWKVWAKQDVDVSVRAKELIVQVDQHYDYLLKRTWETVEQAEAEGSIRDKISALKLATTLEKDRVAIYQQAGVSAADEVAAQLAENERKQAILVEILRDVTGKCNRCKVEVRSRLAEYNNEAQEIPIVSGEVVR